MRQSAAKLEYKSFITLLLIIFMEVIIMAKEHWRRVIIGDHKLNYEVSDKGHVRNFKTKKLLKGREGSNGYFRIAVCDASIGYKKDKGIHQLVMDAFNPTDDPNLEINHLDGDKSNNRLSNLKWVTHQENMKHAHETDLFRTGEDCYLSKYTEEDIKSVCGLLELGFKYNDIMNQTGVHSSEVRKIARGGAWRCVADNYDFDELIEHRPDRSNIYNSLDRAIISDIDYKSIIDRLICFGMSKQAAEELVYNRQKKIKRKESIVQCTVYIDEGEEIF